VNDPALKAKVEELHRLTFEEDGSLKNKLIMNVQPSFDETENTEVLKLPEDIVKTSKEVNDKKEARKAQIQQSREK
jgi:hypothetical protein